MSIRRPKGEVGWVEYHDASGIARFLLTSKPTREYYFLYEVSEDGTLTKLGKAKSPPELEKKFQVFDKIG